MARGASHPWWAKINGAMIITFNVDGDSYWAHGEFVTYEARSSTPTTYSPSDRRFCLVFSRDRPFMASGSDGNLRRLLGNSLQLVSHAFRSLAGLIRLWHRRRRRSRGQDDRQAEGRIRCRRPAGLDIAATAAPDGFSVKGGERKTFTIKTTSIDTASSPQPPHVREVRGVQRSSRPPPRRRSMAARFRSPTTEDKKVSIPHVQRAMASINRRRST